MAAALPFVQLGTIPGLPMQPYGLMMMLATAAGVTTTVLLGRRRGLAVNHLALVVPIAVIAAMLAGHAFDVLAYRADRAGDLTQWTHVYEGHSLFGALAGIALTVVLLAPPFQRAYWADVVALGCLVAMTVGRVGCALVHDHPGVPTDSVFGVDFPVSRVHGVVDDIPLTGTIRLHDLGLEELLVMIPLTVFAFALARRHLRTGMVAGVTAIIYAVVRFGLDFLRAPQLEPRHIGLTAGQWGCVVMLALAGLAVALMNPRAPRVSHGE